MDPDLASVVAALAELGDGERAALIVTAIEWRNEGRYPLTGSKELVTTVELAAASDDLGKFFPRWQRTGWSEQICEPTEQKQRAVPERGQNDRLHQTGAIKTT
jgi:hypothetical protein